MSQLFVNESDEIVVNIVVAKGKNGEIFADASEELLMQDSADVIDENAPMEHYEAKFRRMTFRDSINISRDIFSTADNQSVDFNPLMLRFRKIVALIKDWSFVDKDGVKIEPTEENIAKLHPTIANAIGTQLDIQTVTL